MMHEVYRSAPPIGPQERKTRWGELHDYWFGGKNLEASLPDNFWEQRGAPMHRFAEGMFMMQSSLRTQAIAHYMPASEAKRKKPKYDPNRAPTLADNGVAPTEEAVQEAAILQADVPPAQANDEEVRPKKMQIKDEDLTLVKLCDSREEALILMQQDPPDGFHYMRSHQYPDRVKKRDREAAGVETLLPKVYNYVYYCDSHLSQVWVQDMWVWVEVCA